MAYFKTYEDFVNFMDLAARMIPSDELTSVVIDDLDWDMCTKRSMEWYGPSQRIVFHKRSIWLAEQQYRATITELEAKIKDLEASKG